MKKIALLFVLLFAHLANVHGSVARSDSGTTFINSADASVSTLSLTTLTVSGSSPCLIAWLSTRFDVTVTAINWDDSGTPQPMTEIGTGSINGAASIHAYLLINPTAGNKVLKASWSSGGAISTLAAANFSGADQSTCIVTGDNISLNGNNASPSTGSITSASGDATVGMLSARSAGISSPSQTVIYTDFSSAFVDSAGTYSTSGSNATHSWTIDSSNWAVIGIHIKAASTGVQVDSSYNSGYKAASSSYTIPSVNCGGSNRFVLVGTGMLSVAGASVSSVAMTDLTFTRVGVVTSATGTVRAELWQGIAPAAAARDITVTYSTSLISGAGAVCFSGVHQTSPTEAENDNTATNGVGAADATVAITTIADNDYTFAVVATDDTSVTTGQTSQFNITGAGGSVVGETFGPQTPAGAKTMNFTGIAGLATWAIDGIAIRAVADAAITTRSSMTLLGVQ